MQDQHSKTHADIAREIRLAKKRMFKRHRAGAGVSHAGKLFLNELSDVIKKHVLAEGGEAGDATSSQPQAKVPIYFHEPARLDKPEDSSIDSIVQLMQHSPEYERALLERRAQIGDRPLFDIKNRAVQIIDDADTYCKSVRDRVDDALNADNDLDALIEIVEAAEQGRDGAPVESDDSASDFDPREAVESLLGVICGGLTPEVESDLLYNLLTFASERQDALDSARLSDAKRLLFPYTSIGDAGMRQLDDSIAKGGAA